MFFQLSLTEYFLHLDYIQKNPSPIYFPIISLTEHLLHLDYIQKKPSPTYFPTASPAEHLLHFDCIQKIHRLHIFVNYHQLSITYTERPNTRVRNWNSHCLSIMNANKNNSKKNAAFLTKALNTSN